MVSKLPIIWKQVAQNRMIRQVQKDEPTDMNALVRTSLKAQKGVRWVLELRISGWDPYFCNYDVQ